MDALSCAISLAGPVGELGARFYFDDATRGRAKELGLRSIEYYGLGRAGVMGDVEPEAVARAFTFFSPAAIERMYGAPRERCRPSEVAVHYLGSADAYAERVYAQLDESLLAGVADAAFRVAAVVPEGRYPVFDGYRRAGRATSAAASAHRGVILLRELRGGVHIDAVRESGLSPADAAYLEDPAIFSLHGYAEEDRSDLADGAQRRSFAEDATSTTMADFFAVLDEGERDDLVAGVAAMAACSGA
ncbi:MAG: hypothetical protein KGJ39_07125 [Acidobacteriota bacterium]|nr:hypothetical protein [Acidobacteriota bacterium]